MSKGIPNKKIVDLTNFNKSTFTLTFVIEVLGMDVRHDCNEGWLDLGPCHQAMKIQYLLYPEQNFDVDVLIWPHIAKIWCGGQQGYVRTWQFLERRWFAFSIRHAFPVRVLELMNHVVTVNCSMGFSAISNNAKNDKNIEAFLPPIKFGERRYFGTVLEAEDTLEKIIQNMLWGSVEEKISASYLDGVFNTPQIVSDIRHQDAVLFNVKEIILNRTLTTEEDLAVQSEEIINQIKSKDRRESKVAKEKEKKKVLEVQKEKFIISLSGDTILSGVGRVIPFEMTGELPQDQSEVIVLISSNNLPAQDDLPIIFMNIESLHNIPTGEFKSSRVSQLYVRWKLGDEEHESQKQYIKSRNSVNFNDHHTLPLPYSKAAEITALFLDNNFEIQLRGLRNPTIVNKQKLYGTEKSDRMANLDLLTQKGNDNDILIAVTRINATALVKNKTGIIKGEFSLYPLKVSGENLDRVGVSTNDINGIRKPVVPDFVIQPSVILDKHMTLDVSIGFVGCKPNDFIPSYSRFFCRAKDPKTVGIISHEVEKINSNLINLMERKNLLTGFALDAGDIFLVYIEGKKDGPILNIWDLTADFYPNMKPAFSCSEKYGNRIYSELLSVDNIPFQTLKMFVPLNTLLACPQVYVKPALPQPAKNALLKIGHLVASKIKVVPFTNEILTYEELESFKLELCVPPRTNSFIMPPHNNKGN